jgi:hypothetical protein
LRIYRIDHIHPHTVWIELLLDVAVIAHATGMQSGTVPVQVPVSVLQATAIDCFVFTMIASSQHRWQRVYPYSASGLPLHIQL